MKAIQYTEYGSPNVLHLTEVTKPTPKDNEVLIKIHATTVNFGDVTARKMGKLSPSEFHMSLPFWLIARIMFGFRKPKINILGAEFAGEIEAVGQDVTRFKTGDSVFGYVGSAMGANAEYLCMAEDGVLAIKPNNMSYEEATTIPYGATMALPILEKGNLQPGQKILINGASGGIGSAALQLAKYYGAEVTAVCSTSNLEMVKSLGADKVIDYTQEDFTQNGETYDVILDILGKSSFSACKDSLKPNGVYLLASFKMKPLFQMLWTSITRSNKNVICALATESSENLAFAKELIEEGKIKTVIDRCFPLEQTAEAHHYIESGDKKGQIVITVVT